MTRIVLAQPGALDYIDAHVLYRRHVPVYCGGDGADAAGVA